MKTLATVFNEVHTKRLVLRRPTPNDGDAMFMVHGDPATNQYNPYGPDPDIATSKEELQLWLSYWQDNDYGYWAVMRMHSEAVIGFGGVMRMRWRDRDVLNLYYRLTPSTWRQGYANELAQAAVDLARTHLPQLPIVARTRPANIASIRTAERAGLVRRPDLDTEHVIFALGWPSEEEAR